MIPSACINAVYCVESICLGIKKTTCVEFLKAAAVAEGLGGVKVAGVIYIFQVIVQAQLIVDAAAGEEAAAGLKTTGSILTGSFEMIVGSIGFADRLVAVGEAVGVFGTTCNLLPFVLAC